MQLEMLKYGWQSTQLPLKCNLAMEIIWFSPVVFIGISTVHTLYKQRQ